MEAIVEAAEATMIALVTAADDFARPLVAAQRAALDAAVAAAGSNPPASFEEDRSEFEAELRELEAALASALSEERDAIAALAAAARADANADDAAVAARFDPARAALGERLRERRARAEASLASLEAKRANLTRAADPDADAPGADASKQDWAADDDDEDALPPLAAMGWAEDDDDELPPLDAAWANEPAPPSPKGPPPVAFKPRDDPADAPRGSVFSRLSGGERDSPWNRGGGGAGGVGGPPPSRDRDRERERERDPPPRASRDGGGGRGVRSDRHVNPHDIHREMMRQERERNPNASPPVNRPVVRGGASASHRAPRTTDDVVYLSRDEQRAAAAKREEDAAWRLAREPIAEFHGKAQKGEPFPPSACRELLNALSEPPFAEGRLAPNARKAFETVAGPPKSAKRADAEVEGMVRGVINPLYHLLTHGVSVPGGGGAGSTGAFIAEQMHVAAVKLLSAALDALSKGETTAAAVESAKGIVVVREQVAAKLSGKAPGGGKGDRDGGAVGRGGGGGGASGAGWKSAAPHAPPAKPNPFGAAKPVDIRLGAGEREREREREGEGRGGRHRRPPREHVAMDSRGAKSGGCGASRGSRRQGRRRSSARRLRSRRARRRADKIGARGGGAREGEEGERGEGGDGEDRRRRRDRRRGIRERFRCRPAGPRAFGGVAREMAPRLPSRPRVVKPRGDSPRTRGSGDSAILARAPFPRAFATGDRGGGVHRGARAIMATPETSSGGGGARSRVSGGGGRRLGGGSTTPSPSTRVRDDSEPLPRGVSYPPRRARRVRATLGSVRTFRGDAARRGGGARRRTGG